MLQRTLRTLGVTLFVWAASGCVEGGPPVDGAGAPLAISVAALSLPGITDADYTVTVTNGPDGAGEIVWQRAIDSIGYGDGGGSASIVGTCDADAGVNSVTLELDALYQGAGVLVDAATYLNPTPITKNVSCQANGDTQVVFDMTLARAAQQGFFDVAVSFEDVFCSAKLDCVRDGTADDLDLLHNPLLGGARDLTAVLAFACTGSPTATDTYLYMDDPVVTCSGLADPVTFDVSGQGNVDLAAATSQNPGAYLFGAAVYRGDEQLAGKAYWNVQLGLNSAAFAAAGDCTLVSRATASSSAWPLVDGGFPLPEGSVYPVIDWSVPLTDAAGRVCTTHPVNGGNGVATHYLGYLAVPNGFTWADAPIFLRHRYTRGGSVETPDDLPVLTPAAPTVSGTPSPGTIQYAGTVALSDFNQTLTATVATATGSPIGLPRVSTDGVHWATTATVHPGDALYLRFEDAWLTNATFTADLTVGGTQTTFSVTTGTMDAVAVDFDTVTDFAWSGLAYTSPYLDAARTTTCTSAAHDAAAGGLRVHLNQTATCGAGRATIRLRFRAVGDFDATWTYHDMLIPQIVAIDPAAWRRDALVAWIHLGPVHEYFDLIEVEATSWSDSYTPPAVTARLWDYATPDQFTTSPSAPGPCLGTAASPCTVKLTRRGDTFAYYVNGVLFGSGPYVGDYADTWTFDLSNTNTRDDLTAVVDSVTMTAVNGGALELDHTDPKYTSDEDAPY
ncbi:MAG: hypothetical protein EP329_23520 [Deltaproteobacteria bacterium]|nr:MAG: hypothetical protein EP329_23520 [Deltaproteobacteria bacterium]